jgi:hypothetical protein
MSKHLPKPSHFINVSLSIPSVLLAEVARSQSKNEPKEFNLAIPNADRINKQIEKNYPPEMLADGKSANPTKSPGVPTTAPALDSNTTAISLANNTIIFPTPAIVAILVIVGGLALFPVVHLLLNSKKAAEIGKNSIWSKLGDRFQKPKVLESDAFLHQRSFDKLAEITNQAENINADKFGSAEFMTFFKLKSYIARSIDEYANLDEVVELFNVAISAQASFAAIDSIESRNCSSVQQEFYAFVTKSLTEGLEEVAFQAQIDLKFQELLPRLKTDEGRVALETYKQEAFKISTHPLAIKLLLLFKKYQLDDYSILRSVSQIISSLDSEDLLNLDSLLVLVMTKYEVFEKLGPIVGVKPEYNRPETYSKMLQYIGLKSRHEASFAKFKEFLIILKPWEVQSKTIRNVREKYNSNEHRIPKNFTAELPGLALYKKYKDSFHLLDSFAPKIPEIVITTPAQVPDEVESPMLTGVK